MGAALPAAVPALDFNETEIERTARTFQAIAHPLRLSIVCVLAEGEACVQDILAALRNCGTHTSQPNISQHLAMLYDRGILSSRKEANRVIYALREPRLLDFMGLMRDIYCGAR